MACCASYAICMSISEFYRKHTQLGWFGCAVKAYEFCFFLNSHEDAQNLNLMTLFPDLFENAFKFAKMKGWNDNPSLKEWLAQDIPG